MSFHRMRSSFGRPEFLKTNSRAMRAVCFLFPLSRSRRSVPVDLHLILLLLFRKSPNSSMKTGFLSK